MMLILALLTIKPSKISLFPHRDKKTIIFYIDNKKRYMYTCDYCKNNMYYSQINWKLNDIEVNDIKYKI